jgi:hypothetical protein
MSHASSQTNSIDCLFITILGAIVPFHLVGNDGDVATIQAAVLELVEGYAAANAPELDLVGRMIGFGTAVMDNLRLSARSGLSDSKILRYRSNAIALNRSAEQCRKTLEAMQAKRLQHDETATVPLPVRAAAPTPSQPHPLPELVSEVEGDPAFATDIETMRRNTRAMLADMQAWGKQQQHEAAETSIAHITRLPSRSTPSGNIEIV